ncbi:hypothetical protein GR255_27715, partial [Mycobacterium tuberculosis]|nr:hypothetical protein [Mycobacterium tuberculosis]
VWESAGAINAQGEGFLPNMPTEEVFTAPDFRRAVKAWEEHAAILKSKADMLNKEQFSAPHYTAPGTNLTLGLPKNHVWESAGAINAQGEGFLPNMPTEEVFTAPDFRRA